MAELLDREAKLNALADFDKLDTGLQVYVNTNATNNNNTNVVVSIPIPQPILHSPPSEPEKTPDVENGSSKPNGGNLSNNQVDNMANNMTTDASLISEEPNGSEVQHVAQIDDVVPFIFTTRRMSSRAHRYLARYKLLNLGIRILATLQNLIARYLRILLAEIINAVPFL